MIQEKPKKFKITNLQDPNPTAREEKIRIQHLKPMGFEEKKSDPYSNPKKFLIRP